MLLTTCPNCAAQFKVQPEQLNVRQGRVMCGRCRQVFDAFQSLTRIEDAAIDAAATSVGVAAVRPAETEAPTSLSATDAIFMRSEPAPFPELTGAEPLSQAADAGSAMHSEAVGQAVDPGAPYSPEATATVERNPSRAPGAAVPGLILESENPLLAEPPLAFQRAPARNGPWTGAAILLAVVLVAQLVYMFRSQIALQFPLIRPGMVAICDWAGCTVPRSRDESAIRIEASDLVEAPGRTGRILLTATISNRSAAAQEYPALELRLSDSSNQAVLSRVFSPADYLGRAIAREESIAPGGEVFVNMQIELLSKTPASGYGVRAFYP
jgi:predicted Zn finger-like uncharacterized protein